MPTEQVVGFTPPASPDRPVTGGGSFGTAATLPGSGRYVEQMRFGEYLFYRVRLNWGQGLAYTVHYPAAAANSESTLHNPARSSVAWSTTAFTGGAATLPGGSDSFSKGKGYFGTVPIRYRNRELSGDNAALSVAGWNYIAVKLGRLSSLSDQSTAAPLPVLLEVSVVGTPEKGPQCAGTPAQDSFGAPPGGRTVAHRHQERRRRSHGRSSAVRPPSSPPSPSTSSPAARPHLTPALSSRPQAQGREARRRVIQREANRLVNPADPVPSGGCDPR